MCWPVPSMRMAKIAFANGNAVVVSGSTANARCAKPSAARSNIPLRVAFSSKEPLYRIGIGTQAGDQGSMPINRDLRHRSTPLVAVGRTETKALASADANNGGWRVSEVADNQSRAGPGTSSRTARAAHDCRSTKPAPGPFAASCWIAGEDETNPRSPRSVQARAASSSSNSKPTAKLPSCAVSVGTRSDVTQPRRLAGSALAGVRFERCHGVRLAAWAMSRMNRPRSITGARPLPSTTQASLLLKPFAKMVRFISAVPGKATNSSPVSRVQNWRSRRTSPNPQAILAVLDEVPVGMK